MKKFKIKIICFFCFLIVSFFICEIVFGNCPKVFSRFFSYIAIFSNKLKFGFIGEEVNCFKELNLKDLYIKPKYKKIGKDTSYYYDFSDDSSYFEEDFNIKNIANVPYDVILKASKKAPFFSIEKTTKPQVLIYHTHTTESYGGKKENCNFNFHSKNPTKSVVAVGEQIEEALEENYIKTVHDTKIHDSPSYMGSYFRSLLNMKKNIKKYPTIQVMLDIHRDYRSCYEEKFDENLDFAKITIVVGSSLEKINFEKNLAFAFCLQKQLEKDMPNITNPIELKNRNYNQDFGPVVLLIKIGNNEDSLAKAKFSGNVLGEALSKILIGKS